MGLPLPRVVADVGPGGPIVTSMRGTNALTQSNLENEYRRLQNQYYAPNIQSEINQRNALTEGQTIHNKYLPEEYRIANALNQQKFEWNPRNWQSENANRNALTNKTNQMLPYQVEAARLANQMTPLEIEQQRIKNQYLPESEKARIAYQNMGGGRGSVEQKDLAAFNNQLQADNPMQPNESQDQYMQRISDLSDAYGRGDTTLLNGAPIKPMSWRAQQLQNSVMNRNIPVAARNQLIQMDTLVDDMKDFDIDAIANFAGPQGKIRLASAKSQMAINPDDPSIDPMARRYLSSMNQAILNMDQMRKALGTSVVPDYVYKTVGRLTNPNDSIWNDKTQVKKSYNDIVNTLDRNRNNLRNKYRGGINASSNKGSSKKNVSEMSNEEIEQELAQLRGGK